MGKIFLTAGHYDQDSGATAQGFKENKLTIELRDMTYEQIKRVDPEAEVWRDNDSDNLSKVIAKIKEIATAEDLLVEIHFDAATGKATGTTVLVANDARTRSRQIAEDLAIGVSGTIGIRNRGVKNESESQHTRLGILHTKASSALLEVGFIDSEDMFKYEAKKECVAKEIALIILKHLNNGK